MILRDVARIVIQHRNGGRVGRVVIVANGSLVRVTKRHGRIIITARERGKG